MSDLTQEIKDFAKKELHIIERWASDCLIRGKYGNPIATLNEIADRCRVAIADIELRNAQVAHEGSAA